MGEENIDHVVWQEASKSGYRRLSIVARLQGPRVSNVQYMVRLEKGDCEPLDFMLTLDGFKKLGELLIALNNFCKEPIYASERNVDTLKKLLTSENIKLYSQMSALKTGN